MSKSSNSSGRDENTASSIGAVNINVLPLDNTSEEIIWDKVPDPDVNDPIRRYTICYQLHPGVTKDAKMKKIVDGSILSTKITGLNEDTKYYVSIFASTDSEDGPFGNEMEFRTVSRDFEDGDIYRFWSYQSKRGDAYICMTTTSNGTDGYTVHAGGIKNNFPTELTFVQPGGTLLTFILNFQKDDIAYSLSASETDVKAIKYSQGNTREATKFQVLKLEEPNKPYIMLKKAADEDLFLSSDGAGNMKLKASNVDDPAPSFLFRAVFISAASKVVEPV